MYAFIPLIVVFSSFSENFPSRGLLEMLSKYFSPIPCLLLDSNSQVRIRSHTQRHIVSEFQPAHPAIAHIVQ